jgi:ABC-type multidrug transport system ATPase subunit
LVFAAPELHLVERLCTKIGIMVKGRLAIEDTVEGLREKTGTATFDDAFIKAVGGDIGSGEIEWLHNSSN